MTESTATIPELRDTSGGTSRRLAEALQEISPQNNPMPAGFTKTALALIRAYFSYPVSAFIGRLGMAASQIRITAECPLALVTAAPMVEKLRLDRALKTLESIPEGKDLVDTFRKSGVPLRMEHDFYRVGASILTRQEGGGSTSPTAECITLPAFSNHGRLVAYLAHELQHLRQQQQGILFLLPGKNVSPLETIWYERAIEADAQATAVDVAYKLKEAGQPAAWDELKRGRSAPGLFTQAYEEVARWDPGAVKSGHAKRAAYDAWFEAKFQGGYPMQAFYTGQGMGKYPGVRVKVPLAPLAPEDILRIGALSRINYLALPGTRAVDDPYYRQKSYNPYQAKWLADQHVAYQNKVFGQEASAPEKGVPAASQPKTAVTPAVPQAVAGQATLHMAMTPARPVFSPATPAPPAPRMR